MIAFLLGAIGAIGLCWLLFVFYLAVMCLKIARDAGKLTPGGKVFGYPVLAIGYLLDFLVQVTLAVLLFWELPRETTVSGRVKRHCATGGGAWRARLAWWLRDQLLAPYDPSGGHS
jgi:hypothetical protein